MLLQCYLHRALVSASLACATCLDSAVRSYHRSSVALEDEVASLVIARVAATVQRVVEDVHDFDWQLFVHVVMAVRRGERSYDDDDNVETSHGEKHYDGYILPCIFSQKPFPVLDRE